MRGISAHVLQSLKKPRVLSFYMSKVVALSELPATPAAVLHDFIRNQCGSVAEEIEIKIGAVELKGGRAVGLGHHPAARCLAVHSNSRLKIEAGFRNCPTDEDINFVGRLKPQKCSEKDTLQRNLLQCVVHFVRNVTDFAGHLSKTKSN
jgi:hypothetical protein